MQFAALFSYFLEKTTAYIIGPINSGAPLAADELLISFAPRKIFFDIFYGRLDREEFSQWSDADARVRSRGQSRRCALLLRPGWAPELANGHRRIQNSNLGDDVKKGDMG